MTPRACSVSAIALAPPTLRTTSSLFPETIRRVRLGLKPWPARASAASISATSEPLSSIEPRPQTAPSRIAPEKGGAFHWLRVSSATGTTSWWAIRMIGSSEGSEPFQV